MHWSEIMAIDINKAQAFVAAGISDNLAIITEKRKWETQVEGAYDLMFKYINEDYITRKDLQIFLDQLFTLHYAADGHVRAKSTIVPPLISKAMPPTLFKSGAAVKGGSKINAIGYGVYSEDVSEVM